MVDIVVGGQLGSEGKGKTVKFWAEKTNACAVVRVGGSNSGHTTYDSSGNKHALRGLSSGSTLPMVETIIPGGGFVDMHVLLNELRAHPEMESRLKIDPKAVLILEKT